MALSSAALTASEIALAAADKPILGAITSVGLMTTTSGTPGWAWSTTNDADNPGYRAADGLTNLNTTPTTAGTSHTFTMGFSSSIEFDFFGIIGHNASTWGASTVLLTIANDFAMSSGNIDISSVASTPTSARMSDLTLFHTGSTALRYSGVDFAKLTLTTTNSVKPSIGEIIFGRRYQLRYEPNRPWDPTDQRSSVDDFETRSGVVYRTTRYRGRRMISAKLNPDVTADQTNLTAWYAATNQGANPFVWIDKPNSLPAKYNVMLQDEPSMEFPYVMWNTRELNLQAKEQGPDFLAIE